MAVTITPNIVTVATHVISAPQLSQLQQSGAIVSAGGTTLASNASQYCGNMAAVTAILQPAVAISTLTWAAGVVTATVSGSLNLAAGQTFVTTIAGAVPDGYNGTYVATVSATADEITYAVATDPGTATVHGTYTVPGAAFVNDAAFTYFAQGTTQGVYILELGAQTSWSAAVTAFGTWIVSDNNNPQQYYAYLLDPIWDSEDSAGLATITNAFSSPTGQTYFFVSTSLANIPTYQPSKSVFALVPAPTAPAAEVTAAAPFWQWLANTPGPASVLAPMAYRYVFDVTPWQYVGNATQVNNILTASGNVIMSGSEGGISTDIVFRGTVESGEQASFWFGVDYFRIQVASALAAAIINGSNTSPPLLYSQSGINALLAVAQRIANNAVAYGCASSIAVSAIPFATYVTQNPNDYANGIYNGLAAQFVGQSGFLTITFNLDAVAFS